VRCCRLLFFACEKNHELSGPRFLSTARGCA
jgi:hypothetical protein